MACPAMVFPQHEIGMGLYLNRDFSKLSDPGGQLASTPRLNTQFCLVYRYTFKNNIFLGSGIALKNYSESLGFRFSRGYSSGSGGLVFQVPVLLGKKFYLFRDKFYISPLLGSTLNLTMQYDTPYYRGGGHIKTPIDSVSYSESSVNYQHYFLTLNLGFEMGVYVSRALSLNFTMRYNAGFKPVTREFITYHHPQLQDNVTAVKTINGGYLTYFAMELRFRLRQKDKTKNALLPANSRRP